MCINPTRVLDCNETSENISIEANETIEKLYKLSDLRIM